MKTFDIFPITLYEAEFPNFDKIQQSVIDLVLTQLPKETYNGHDHPIMNGAITMLFDRLASNDLGVKIENPIIKDLHDFIHEHGKKYWEVLNFSKKLNPYVLQLWANAVPKGGFVASHNHNPTPISGVFYINATPDMGNLYLENPLDLVLGKSIYNTETRTPKRFNYEIESYSGKLVLFPGWMKHFTKANTTDNLRMSMAVNFGCWGNVFISEFM
jgi:uncharacterized protein (TIGR02466 family)